MLRHRGSRQQATDLSSSAKQQHNHGASESSSSLSNAPESSSDDGGQSLPSQQTRCNLRLIFIVSTVAQVLIAALVLWAIGYTSQLSIKSKLSLQLLQETQSHAVDSVSQLLASPIRAVTYVDALTATRFNENKASIFESMDYTSDSTYVAEITNSIKLFSGTTAVDVTSLTGGVVGAILDVLIDPPPLYLFYQGTQSNFSEVIFQVPNFTQQLSSQQLFRDTSLLSIEPDFFPSLSTSLLLQGIQESPYVYPYTSPLSPNLFFTTCAQQALKFVKENNATAETNIPIQWILPRVARNNTLGLATGVQLCRSGVLLNPNASSFRTAAQNALTAGSPEADNLLSIASSIDNATAYNESFPVVTHVSLTTWNALAIRDFLENHLNSFVSEDGVGFLVTSEFDMIASTSSNSNISQLLYLPDFFADPVQTQYTRDTDSTGFGFLQAMNEDLTDFLATYNLSTIVNQDVISTVSSFSVQSTRTVNGQPCYVQTAVLSIPGSFYWLLIMYSPQSDYDGDLYRNLVISSCVALAVLVVSVVCTLILTQIIHRPLIVLMSAMLAVVGQQKYLSKQPRARAHPPKQQVIVESMSNSQAPDSTKTNAQTSSSSVAFGNPMAPITDNRRALSLYVFNHEIGAQEEEATRPRKQGSSLALLEYDLKRSSSQSQQQIDRSSQGSLILPAAVALEGASAQPHQLPSSRSSSLDNSFMAQDRLRSAPLWTAAVFDHDQRHSTAQDVSVQIPSPSQDYRHLPHQHDEQSPSASQRTIVSPFTVAPLMPVQEFGRRAQSDSESRSRSSNSNSEHEASSYELDRLLRKWTRTMEGQGLETPSSWASNEEMQHQWQSEQLNRQRRKLQAKAAISAVTGLDLPPAGKTHKTNDSDVFEGEGFSSLGLCWPCKSSDQDEKDVSTSSDTPPHSQINQQPRLPAKQASSTRALPRSNSRQSSSGVEAQSNISNAPGLHSRSSSTHILHDTQQQPLASNVEPSTSFSASFLPSFMRTNRPSPKPSSASQPRRKGFLNFIGFFGEVVQLEFTFGHLLNALRSSQLKLERASQAKQSFLRFIFHEIRIPLNALSLSVVQLEEQLVAQEEAARNPADPDDLLNTQPCLSPTFSNASSISSDSMNSLDLLAIIKDQVASVTRLLNDVLSFQRMEENQLVLEMNEYCVQSMIQNVLISFSSEFKNKHLKVEVAFAADPQPNDDLAESAANASSPQSQIWRVVGDQHRLKQCISNFISNACKFSPVGGTIQVWARLTPVASIPLPSNDNNSSPPQSPTHNASGSAGWLEIQVQDHGVGISPESLQLLFRPYAQIRAGSLQNGNGSGLGLNIAKKIIELHGGSIHVQSEENKGSNFAFAVPVRIVAIEVAPLTPSPLELAVSDTRSRPALNMESITMQLPTPSNASSLASASASTQSSIMSPSVMTGTFSPSTDSPSYQPRQLSAEPLTSTPTISSCALLARAPLPTVSHVELLQLPSSLTKALPSNGSDAQLTASMNDASPSLNTRSLVSTTPKQSYSSQLRAFVCEDSPINRKLLIMMLRGMGCTVESAEDGQLGFDLILEKLKQHGPEKDWEPFDILLVDDTMPNMSGAELVYKLRTELNLKAPIYAVTGNALLEDQQRLISAGCDEVFTKPVSKPTIANALQRARELIAAKAQSEAPDLASASPP